MFYSHILNCSSCFTTVPSFFSLCKFMIHSTFGLVSPLTIKVLLVLSNMPGYQTSSSIPIFTSQRNNGRTPLAAERGLGRPKVALQLYVGTGRTIVAKLYKKSLPETASSFEPIRLRQFLSESLCRWVLSLKSLRKSLKRKSQLVRKIGGVFAFKIKDRSKT